MKTKVLNLDNKAAGDVELNDAIFGLEPRADLIQRVVVWQLAKRRSGQHKVLTRGEINRTKQRVGKQKGGGTARHGARSAPLFVGGAKAMGPVVALPRVRPAQEGQGAGPEARAVVQGQGRLDRHSRRSQVQGRSRPARWPSSSARWASARRW